MAKTKYVFINALLIITKTSFLRRLHSKSLKSPKIRLEGQRVEPQHLSDK